MINRNNNTEKYESTKYKQGKRFIHISFIDKKTSTLFGCFLNGVTKEEIKIGLKILADNKFLSDYASNTRGEMLQKHLSDSGKIGVIGGKNIDKYGVKNLKGFIDDPSLISKKGRINENSILVQNIVAHIKNPFDRIQITACITSEEVAVIDTINQITLLSNKVSNKFIWALLNSRLLNWYCYLFIYGKAIRTMHFDSPATSKIPIKIPTNQSVVNQIEGLVEEILLQKKQGAATGELEAEVDRLVYKLYGLSDKEIEVVEG